MKATIYTVTMADNKPARITARSAGEAIYQALAKFPGQTVAACHSGLTVEQANALRASGKDAMAGIISYEVPPHKAMTESEACVVRGDDEE